MCSCLTVKTSLQVIYELTEGERQLIADLSLAKKVCSMDTFKWRYSLPDTDSTYFDTPFSFASVHMFGLCWCFQVYYEPMLKLEILTESELGIIFGTLDSLIPLHEGEHSHVFVASLCHRTTPVMK